ncbi:putative RING-H2 finger protein ATL21B [Spatholobus suberectus]|nr:putative RING-H2 finger protein ATL21B [Spatholobus suberectus]
MATLAHLCLPLLMFLLPLRGEVLCDHISCGEIDIQFPFGLRGANQRCRYPRFQLSCDNRSRTILSLPGSGDLVVKSINYKAQTVKVNDPEGCLPKRFLHNLSLSLHPPFMFVATVYDLTFLRCPSNITDSHPLPPISCLADSNSSSVIFSWWPRGDTSPWRDQCEMIASAFVPIPNPDTTTSFFLPDLNNDVELKWNEPACGDCAGRGEVCGSPGTRVNKLDASLLLVLTKAKQGRPSTALPSSITIVPPPSFKMGLNGPEIEKFPKTLLGDSGRLPNSNDNTCPICLSEYEPKETLRTIPECNHYFHAQCIDQWLKMNATCPLCRNSPDPSSAVTPSSSSLSIYSSLP